MVAMLHSIVYKILNKLLRLSNVSALLCFHLCGLTVHLPKAVPEHFQIRVFQPYPQIALPWSPVPGTKRIAFPKYQALLLYLCKHFFSKVSSRATFLPQRLPIYTRYPKQILPVTPNGHLLMHLPQWLHTFFVDHNLSVHHFCRMDRTIFLPGNPAATALFRSTHGTFWPIIPRSFRSGFTQLFGHPLPRS